MNGSSATSTAGLCTAVIIAAVGHAQTVHDVPQEFATIQAAIDAADPGDIVRVHSGTYAESIDFRSKSLTVESASGPESTLLDAGGVPGPAVIMNAGDGDGAVLRGFTVTGGNGVNGGGLFLTGRGLVEQTTFENNTADLGGAAFVAGEATFVDATFDGNTARLGGALYTGVAGSATVQSAAFRENTAASGGAIFAAPLSFGEGGVDVADSDFDGNAASADGGAVVLVARSLSAQNARFSENEAASNGGALCLALGSDAAIESTDFFDNVAGELGGALFNAADTPVNVFGGSSCGNLPESFGGAVAAENVATFCVNGGGACLVDMAAPLGALNGADVSAFVWAYRARNAAADLSGDGAFSSVDVTMFISMWRTGCAT